MRLRERARAKVNLTLAVVGRRDDGYHLIDSLVAFASTSDELVLEAGVGLGLTVHGPTAQVAGPDADNLVLRAAGALAERVPGLVLGHFTLLKRLPVAAGLGGGSSDAAAALRLLARANGFALDDARLAEAAAATGADVPVCLAGTARRMTGVGEALSDPIALPRLHAILVNPGVATPTAAVFRALGAIPSPPRPLPRRLGSRAALLAALRAAPNDLEPAAIAVSPVIAEALAAVAATPDCRLARMSGSGATVFGLYDDCRRAAAAAKAVSAGHAGWWVRTALIA
jgi:4-diphosphocytidyl-2-C-methyl-D-erythritol kinase